jgi:hypothetical protein
MESWRGGLCRRHPRGGAGFACALYTRGVSGTGCAQPRLVLAFAVLTALVSSAMCAGAVLAPAPPMAIPLVVVICVGSPLVAGWQVPRALVSLRAQRAERGQRRALAALRENLQQLPEIEHPLGL